MIANMNRGAKILIVALAIGILIIGVSQMIPYSSSLNNNKPTNNSNKEINYFNELTAKAELLRSGPLDPIRFNSLDAAIDSYLEQQLITDAAAVSLKSSINKIFTGRVYRQCDYFLKGLHGTTMENVHLLNLLQTRIGPNQSITNFRSQISWYQYYSVVLPKKVNTFIEAGISNYTEEEYQLLKNQVQNMPGLSSAYSRSSKFKSINASIMKKLFQFNYEYNN